MRRPVELSPGTNWPTVKSDTFADYCSQLYALLARRNGDTCGRWALLLEEVVERCHRCANHRVMMSWFVGPRWSRRLGLDTVDSLIRYTRDKAYLWAFPSREKRRGALSHKAKPAIKHTFLKDLRI